MNKLRVKLGIFGVLIIVTGAIASGEGLLTANSQADQPKPALVSKAAISASTTSYFPLVANNFSPFGRIRTINIPNFVTISSMTDEQWTQAGILWLGINDQGLPGRNYADVRVASTATGLNVRVTVVDYYLWFTDQIEPEPDLTQWDSVALLLDTQFDRTKHPQPDDYLFMTMGRSWVNPSYPNQYKRDGRGNGVGWDMNWYGDWNDSFGGVWSQDPGWNSNAGTLDFGADAVFVLPWASIGQSGPPPTGTNWSLGVVLYDRDTALTSGILPPQVWPDGLDLNNPYTWGVLHFGPNAFTPPVGTEEGVTQVQSESPTDNTVEDAWVGGGGNCIGGHEGGSDLNHGDDTSLFVANQANPADFPCFSKSYLRFSIAAVPQGKKILSATLTLRHWGNANPSNAQPSWVHLFTMSDPWGEDTITWNNAPLALKNISATWIYPRMGGGGNIGDPYNWDATAAVIEAYAQGQPVNLIIYSSDTGMDSSKYLGASEALDIYKENRPLLTVRWGR